MTRSPARPPRPVVVLLAAAGLLATGAVLARGRRPPNLRIADPEGPPRIDAAGVAHSVQAGELTLDPAAVEAVLSATGLDRLGRFYWRFLQRISLGLIRAVPTPERLLVVLLARPLVLLAFGLPEYRVDVDRGLVRWPIHGGLLARGDPPEHARGGLFQIELRRLDRSTVGPASVRIEVAVLDFHPAIARRVGPTVYAFTQARIHVIVTHAFIRSLARIRLAPPDPRG
ncbi:MAG TPA: hypothetical protein VIJ51_18325 [Solirubrobacteraceae bacterium]